MKKVCLPKRLTAKVANSLNVDQDNVFLKAAISNSDPKYCAIRASEMLTVFLEHNGSVDDLRKAGQMLVVAISLLERQSNESVRPKI